MKSPLLLIIFLLIFNVSFGQMDSLAMADSTIGQPKASFTIGTVYANNANYYGQKSQEKTPYIALAANYRFKSGLYVNGLAYKLLNDSTPTISVTNIGIGVNFKIGKRFIADIGYNHSFYQNYSPLLQASNTDNANISLSYNKYIKLELSSDYTFGNTNDIFTTAAISKMISLFSLTKKDIITLDLSVNMVAGTQHFYSTYVQQQKLRDSIFGFIPILGGGNPPPTSTTIKNTQFDIISYNLNIPLAYNRSRYLIEVAYQLSILSKYAQTDAGKSNSFGTLSFYYQF